MSARKPLLWVCSSKKDLKQMPTDVQDVFGYALDLAQSGLKHPDAKPLKGFGDAGVLELIGDFDTNIYAPFTRFVSAVRFKFCTVFRRGRQAELKPLNPTAI